MKKMGTTLWNTGGSLPVMLALAAMMLSSPSLRASTPAPPNRLIIDLSHDDFQTREDARAELWKMGEKSLPALRKAADEKNPETAARAKELILYISIGLEHGSPKALIDLVLQYPAASPNSRYALFNKLIQRGFWKQGLILINKDEFAPLNAQMLLLANQLVTHHVRSAILADDIELAKELLALAPDSHLALMSRAWFYKYHQAEKYTEHLSKASSIKGIDGVKWRLALHCVDGNTSAALKEAEAADIKNSSPPELLNLLRVLEGDAEPWLREQLRNENLSDEIKSAWKLQLLRLNGDYGTAQSRADAMINEIRQGSYDPADATFYASCLAANGYRDYALEIVENLDPAIVSSYHRITNRPAASLASLGIKEDAIAPYTDWVLETSKRALSDNNYYAKIFELALFHHYHGEPEHVLGVMSPLMDKLAENNSVDWYDFIADMVASSMTEQALILLNKRAEDQNAVNQGIRCLLVQDPDIELASWQTIMWQVIQKRNPGNISQSFHEISLLSGLIPDPQRQTSKLHQEITASIPELPEKEQQQLSDSLYRFAKARNDLILAHQIAEAGEETNPAMKHTSLLYDITFQKWVKAEPLLAERVKESPSNYVYWTDWYICLRKLGKKDEATQAYQKMLLLTMMDMKPLHTIAHKLNEVGYDEEALYLWQISTLNDPKKIPAIFFLTSRGQHYYHTEQWEKAAALKEVYLQISMRGQANYANFSSLLNTRFYADFCHGMAQYARGEQSQSIITLDNCRKMVSSGSLADEFFPALLKVAGTKKSGIEDHYQQWFEESYNEVNAVCKKYPHAHNTQNTAAWLSSRAVMRLDNGLAHAKIAVELRPTQGPYLDTMAEIWFAKGNRQKALQWSEKATKGSVSHAQGSPVQEAAALNEFKMLKKQQNHLRNDPLPKAIQLKPTR